jgi:uncharacterized membrane protein
MSNRKRTNRQYNVQQKKDEQMICLFVLFLLNIILSVRSFSVEHYIVCSSFFYWTLYCLFVLFPTEKGRTDNIMFNRKRTNRQYNVQQKLFLLNIILSVRPFSVGHYIICSSFFCWTLYHLFVLFLLDIISSVRPFSDIMFNRKRTNRQYNVQQKKNEQTI